MLAPHRLLLAIDDTAATERAVAYVANVARGNPEFHVRLFHVLPPIPPGLLEHGGHETSDALGAAGKPIFRVHTAGSVGGSTAVVASHPASVQRCHLRYCSLSALLLSSVASGFGFGHEDQRWTCHLLRFRYTM